MLLRHEGVSTVFVVVTNAFLALGSTRNPRLGGVLLKRLTECRAIVSSAAQQLLDTGRRPTQSGAAVQSAVLPDVSINTHGRRVVSTSA